MVWKAIVSMVTAGRVCRTLTYGQFPLPHLHPQCLCTCWLEALSSAWLEEIVGCSAHPPHLPCGEMHWDPVCKWPVCTSHLCLPWAVASETQKQYPLYCFNPCSLSICVCTVGDALNIPPGVKTVSVYRNQSRAFRTPKAGRKRKKKQFLVSKYSY